MIRRKLSLLAGCLALATAAPAAIEIVANFPDSKLKLAGDYPYFTHENWLRLDSIGWSVTSSGTTHFGTDSVIARARMNGVSFSRGLDQVSPVILESLAKGETFPSLAVAFLGIDSMNARYPIATLRLEGIQFSDWKTNGSAGGDQLFENVSLFASAMAMEVFQIGNTQAGTSVYWNFATQSTDPFLPPNAAPTITNPGNVSMAEDGMTVLNFTVADTATVAGALTVTRGTDNPVLLPPDGIILGGTGGNRTVTLQPTSNQSGIANITLQVSDGSLSAQATFRVTVTTVNDAPVVAAISTMVTDQDMPVDVPVTVSDIDSAITSVSLEVTSDNASLLPQSGFAIIGTGAARTLRISPANGEHGTATVTVRAFDGAAYSGPVSFTLIVNQSFGPEIPILLSANSVAENSPAGTLVGMLSAAAPADGETYGFALLDNAGGRFALSGTGNATLEVAPSANLDHESATGHVITMQMNGSAGSEFTHSFIIDVTNVNEPPVVTVPAIGTVSPFAPERVISGIFLDEPDGDEPEATVTLSVTRGTLIFATAGFEAGAILGNATATVAITASLATIRQALSMGALRYQGNFSGSANATLNVSISDNGSGGLGSALSASASTTFPLAIEANQWLVGTFSESQRSNPDIVGALADYDRDGFPTLIEYALGLDPTISDPKPVLDVGEIEVDGQRFMSFTYRRLSPVVDPILIVAPEIASNSFSWNSGPGFTVFVSSTPVPNTNLQEVVIRAAIPLAGDNSRNQMVRLRVDFADQRIPF
jgi:type VI protein secretion system component Hcp